MSKIYSEAGTYSLTLTATDDDGGTDKRIMNVTVEPPVIDFTAITTNSFTFRIRTVAKDNYYQVRTAPKLTEVAQEWNAWLSLEGSNIVVGGNFSVAASTTPSYGVPVNVIDTNGFTLITVDITEIYKKHSNQYFKVVLSEPLPAE